MPGQELPAGAAGRPGPAPGKAKTFVLLHGAWHGGWCWSRVAGPLRAAGQRVYTPTQTGLGERSHLISKNITLDVFVQDLVNVFECEDPPLIAIVSSTKNDIVKAPPTSRE